MTEIPLRELRNETSAVLRRVEEGERLTATVSGRPVAQLVPLPCRRRYLTWEELVAAQADRGLLDDLRELLPETTGGQPINDSWIAATAIAHGIPVATQDDDYDDVPDLDAVKL